MKSTRLQLTFYLFSIYLNSMKFVLGNPNPDPKAFVSNSHSHQENQPQPQPKLPPQQELYQLQNSPLQQETFQKPESLLNPIVKPSRGIIFQSVNPMTIPNPEESWIENNILRKDRSSIPSKSSALNSHLKEKSIPKPDKKVLETQVKKPSGRTSEIKDKGRGIASLSFTASDTVTESDVKPLIPDPTSESEESQDDGGSDNNNGHKDNNDNGAGGNGDYEEDQNEDIKFHISHTMAQKLCKKLAEEYPPDSGGYRRSYLWAPIYQYAPALERGFPLLPPMFSPGCLKWKLQKCNGKARFPMLKPCQYWAPTPIKTKECFAKPPSSNDFVNHRPPEYSGTNCPCKWPCTPYFDPIQQCQLSTNNNTDPDVTNYYDEFDINGMISIQVQIPHYKAMQLCRGIGPILSKTTPFQIDSIPIRIQSLGSSTSSTKTISKRSKFSTKKIESRSKVLTPKGRTASLSFTASDTVTEMNILPLQPDPSSASAEDEDSNNDNGNNDNNGGQDSPDTPINPNDAEDSDNNNQNNKDNNVIVEDPDKCTAWRYSPCDAADVEDNLKMMRRKKNAPPYEHDKPIQNNLDPNSHDNPSENIKPLPLKGKKLYKYKGQLSKVKNKPSIIKNKQKREKKSKEINPKGRSASISFTASDTVTEMNIIPLQPDPSSASEENNDNNEDSNNDRGDSNNSNNDNYAKDEDDHNENDNNDNNEEDPTPACNAWVKVNDDKCRPEVPVPHQKMKGSAGNLVEVFSQCPGGWPCYLNHRVKRAQPKKVKRGSALGDDAGIYKGPGCNCDWPCLPFFDHINRCYDSDGELLVDAMGKPIVLPKRFSRKQKHFVLCLSYLDSDEINCNIKK